MKRRWQVRLAERAQGDFTDIVRWTAEHFGARQARSYATTVRRAVKALDAGRSLIDLRCRSGWVKMWPRCMWLAKVARGGICWFFVSMIRNA